MDVPALLEALRADPAYDGQIVATHVEPRRRARPAELAPPPPEPLAAALAAQGIDSLYSHQVEAITAVRAGHDVVVVTGTASGKSLCYTIPVVESLLADRRARALYLAPLKALGRDQLRKLRDLGLWEQVRPAAYDGDTPVDERRVIRDAANWLLTNPDMLHLGLLPNHARWHSFFAGLKYVIVDEVHTYRGVFGSHAAHVLRRLRRICREHGADPVFIGCSATIGNPGELFEQLTGRPGARIIERNGAPAGRRHVVVWNPPRTRDGRLRSGNIEATLVLRELVQRDLRTLGFALARAEAELVLRYLRAALEPDSPHLTERVAAYRAGYLAEDRRRIEAGLASGELRAVISTVALEAGIDIGGLDVVVMVGYPGTMAGFQQQAGRAGRGARDSLAILVTRESIVDQHFALHPEALWSRPIEAARIDPGNAYIATGHLLCAAFEQPLGDDELERFGPEAESLARICADEGWLARHDHRWYFAGDVYPAAEVSLRAASNQLYELHRADTGEVLGVEDDSRLWDACYPGAIYLHDGETYEVAAVDEAARRVTLAPSDGSWFTMPEQRIEVTIEEIAARRTVGELEVGFGRLGVTRTTVGFRKLRNISFEMIESVPLECPPRTLDTSGLWLVPSPDLRAYLLEHAGDIHGALHAVEHALCGVLPLVALCDPRDVAGSTSPAHPALDAPACFLFDGYPGGIGLAERGFEELDRLLAATRDLIAACRCEVGCPACITRQFCGSFNHPLDKLAAVVVLRAATGANWRQEPSDRVANGRHHDR